MSEPVKVRILDRDFMVGAPPEARESLLESARHLDTRMREIRDAGRIVGIDRIAIMAALNLTHELLEARSAASGTDDIQQRLKALEQEISTYLDSVEMPAELQR